MDNTNGGVHADSSADSGTDSDHDDSSARADAGDAADPQWVVPCMAADGTQGTAVLALVDGGLVLDVPPQARIDRLGDIEALSEAVQAIQLELIARHAHNDNPHRVRTAPDSQPGQQAGELRKENRG